MTDKRELRAHARRLEPPSDAESTTVVAGIATVLSDLPPSQILVYVSMPGELPADHLVAALADRHRFYTTRTPEVGWLTIHDFEAARERHRFGFEQPTAEAAVVDPTVLDVVVVPGLCFDDAGGRVGWGRGYYDQLLGRARPDVVRIGMTLERRIVASVPMEPHDVFMTHLATESGVRTVTGGV
ncbi:MAG: 5-formyltetrahydrofolate cyclo-ligase [Acidimicrobiia bacterium]